MKIVLLYILLILISCSLSSNENNENIERIESIENIESIDHKEYKKYELHELHDFHDRTIHKHKIIYNNGYVIDINKRGSKLHLEALKNDKKNIHYKVKDVSDDAINNKVRRNLFNKYIYYLIHIDKPITAELKERISNNLNIKLNRYMPHSTFLVSLKKHSTFSHSSFINRALLEDGIDWIGLHRNEYKLTSNLNNIEAIDEPNNVYDYQPFKYQGVSAILNLPDVNKTKELVKSILEDVRIALPDSTIWDVVHYEDNRLDFVVPYNKDILPVANFLSTLSSVIAVERKMQQKLKNKWARGIMQFGEVATYSTINPGYITSLSGAGEVVGLLDSGIDQSNCMFYDDLYYIGQNAFSPIYKQPTSSTGYTPSITDLSHRKIIQYISGGNNGDDASVGHGTHTSGSVAGKIDKYSQSGIDPDLFMFNGMAYDAKLQFFDATTDASSFLSIPNINNLLSWAYQAGARVHSNSWGSGTIDNSYTSNSLSFDNYMWNQRDMIVLIAAGNDGDNGYKTITSPSTAKNVIAVGASINDFAAWSEGQCSVNGGPGYISSGTCSASASFYSLNNMASFSSMGPTSDNRFKPDLVSVGHQVLSAKSQGPSTSFPTCPSPGYSTTLKSLSGTSMATPVLAGNVALVRQYYREGWWQAGYRNTSAGFIPSGALLKATIINSGRAITGKQDIGCCAYTSTFPNTDPADGKCCCITSSCSSRASVSSLGVFRSLTSTIPNTIQGYGRPILSKALNLGLDSNFNLLQLLRDTSTILAYDASSKTPQAAGFQTNLGDSTLTTSSSKQTAICVFDANLLGSYPLKVTLAWTDYAASITSGVTLVNNLDLDVNYPTTGTTYYGNGGTGYDSTNNVEQVIISSGITSRTPIIINVSATSVVHGPQPFALVASGPIYAASGSQSAGWTCSGSVVGPTVSPSTVAPTVNTQVYDAASQRLNVIYPSLGSIYPLGSVMSVNWNYSSIFKGFTVVVYKVSNGISVYSASVSGVTKRTPVLLSDIFVVGSYYVNVSTSTGVSAISSTFSIIASSNPINTVSFNSPALGQMFYSGQTITPSWNYSGSDTRSFSVSYKLTSSSSYTLIQSVSSGSTGSLSWNVPSTIGSYMLKIVAATDSNLVNTTATFLVVSTSTYASYVASNHINSTALKLEFLHDLDITYSTFITTANLVAFSSELNVLLNLGVDLSHFIVSVTNSLPIKTTVYIPGVSKNLILSNDASVPPLTSQFTTVSILSQMVNNSFSNTSFNSPFYANLILGRVIRASISQATIIYCSDNSVSETSCPVASASSSFFTLTIIILIAVGGGVFIILVIVYCKCRNPSYTVAPGSKPNSVAIGRSQFQSPNDQPGSEMVHARSSQNHLLSSSRQTNVQQAYYGQGEISAPPMGNAPAPPPQLPPGWTMHDDGQGHIYYFNAQLNKSTWVRPVVIDMRDLK